MTVVLFVMIMLLRLCAIYVHISWEFHVIMILCKSELEATDGQTTESPCLLYAIIRENAVGVTLNICATPERRSHLYTTSTNSVQISIMTENAESSFMLQFQGTVPWLSHSTLSIIENLSKMIYAKFVLALHIPCFFSIRFICLQYACLIHNHSTVYSSVCTFCGLLGLFVMCEMYFLSPLNESL